MRIAVVTSSYPRTSGDPSGHFVAADVEALRSAGHDVTVIAPGRPSDAASAAGVVWIGDGGAFGWPGALHRLRERPLSALGACRFALGARSALMTLGSFERVVAHFIVPSGWPIAFGSRLGSEVELEVVAHGSDVRLLLALPRRARTHIVERLLARRAHFRFSATALRDALARATTEALVAASEVAPSRIALEAAPSRASARQTLGIAPSERLVVVAGRLVEGKRTAVALSAARLVPGARSVVVGDGPELPRLARTFPEVTFVGFVPRPRALGWIAAADVVLSASRDEGAPSVVREARALSVPVVSAPSGDLARWAERDRGLIVVR